MPRGIRSEDKPDVTISPVEVKAATNKAILIVYKDEEYWIPRSQMRDESTVTKKGDKGKLVISAWIAGEKNLSSDADDDGDAGEG
jgi:hypothetical protein